MPIGIRQPSLQHEVNSPSGLFAQIAWTAGLAGLGLFVFGVIGLSSPGRIDVVDGHTRYDVGRSYVEHGDSIVRDRNAWFAVLPGRNSARYTNYRFPQSVVAATAILVSDFTGPRSEARRHFFFSLNGAVLGAAMAILYACWFRHIGHTAAASLAWAGGGIFCTPTWFYSTTTFDDVLGSLAILAAVALALSLGERWPTAAANASGVLLGLTYNCKPPLVLFAPVVVTALWNSGPAGTDRRRQVRSMAIGLASGVIVYKIYDLWKFPPSTWPHLAEVDGAFASLWPGNMLAGLFSLLISPGMGAVWYWPALLLALYGLATCRQSPNHRRLAWMTGISAAAFILFIATIRFFSGEPAWGPRYLTPVFALLWVFVPAALPRLGVWKVAALLAASFVIQIGALSVDTMRFFSGDKEPTASRFLVDPWLYFDLGWSQLLARPRQILEIMTYDGPPAAAFSPAAAPTLPWYVFVANSVNDPLGTSDRSSAPAHSELDLSNPVDRLHEYVSSREPLDPRASHVINSFRPWWVAYRYLPLGMRPVDLDRTMTLLLLTAAGGLTLISVSLCAANLVGWRESCHLNIKGTNP